MDAETIRRSFVWVDGLPAPDWVAVRMRLGSEEPAARRDAVLATARLWLAELGDALDGEYETLESERLLCLAPAGDGSGRHLHGFAEQCRRTLRSVLEDVADFDRYGKPLVLVVRTREDYYRYICRYYPEGEHGGSGGLHVRDGYPHVALHGPNLGELENTLAHELTHVALQHLAMPPWLEEGLAQLIEQQMTGRSLLQLDAETARTHRRFWKPHGLDAFWNGEGFHRSGEIQRLSYELAEILVRLLVEDSRPRWFGRDRRPRRRFLAFLRDARAADHGEASSREHLDRSLADLAAQFLGP